MAAKRKTKRKKKGMTQAWKITLSLLALGIIIAAVIFTDLFRKVYSPNVTVQESEDGYLYIPTGSTYEDVKLILEKQGMIKNMETFEWVVSKMNYKNHIHPGRYKIEPGMNNRRVIQMLRAGTQEPIQFRIQGLQRTSDLAGLVGSHLEADSAMLMALLTDKPFLRQYNLTPENAISMYIPNTYEFYWNTSAREFFNRMILEFDAFWTETRKAKAKALGISATEVITLASIVQKESSIVSERPTIAGVYLNRIRKNWKLQADPTLVFLMEDWDNEKVRAFRKKYEKHPKKKVRRVLNVHKEFESPYNTYLNFGLPPGPITLPDINAIDAVLGAKEHNYFFFCAKPDLSGHNFATTYDEHKVNVKLYREGRKRARLQAEG